jgi:hypothetical protein
MQVDRVIRKKKGQPMSEEDTLSKEEEKDG